MNLGSVAPSAIASLTTPAFDTRLASSPQIDERRIAPRRMVFLHATVYDVECRADGTAINLSASGMKIRSDMRVLPEQRLFVTLPLGCLIPAKVRWTDGEAFGVQFESPLLDIQVEFDAGDGLLATRSTRTRVKFPIKTYIVEKLASARVRNISAQGMMLETDCLPPVGGMIVTQLANGVAYECEPRWVTLDRVGVRVVQPHPEFLVSYADDE